MKLTESMLRRMIREEAARLVESDDYPNWVGPGMKTLPGSAAQADATMRKIHKAMEDLRAAMRAAEAGDTMGANELMAQAEAVLSGRPDYQPDLRFARKRIADFGEMSESRRRRR